MIRALSGDRDVEHVEEWMEERGIREEDEVTVCELFDQYVKQGEERGMEQGIQQGIQQGINQGENRLAKLVQLLMDKGRNEDLTRALSDRRYREQLYMEAKLL